MISRPSSRLFVLDPEDRLLLFRFVLADRTFWATPGGGLEARESFEEAAVRELYEEVGLRVDHPGEQIARRRVRFTDRDGVRIEADERFFLIRTAAPEVSRAGWTPLERQAMAEHRWWTRAELEACVEQVWPEDLVDTLVETGAWPRD